MLVKTTAQNIDKNSTTVKVVLRTGLVIELIRLINTFDRVFLNLLPTNLKSVDSISQLDIMKFCGVNYYFAPSRLLTITYFEHLHIGHCYPRTSLKFQNSLLSWACIPVGKERIAHRFNVVIKVSQRIVFKHIKLIVNSKSHNFSWNVSFFKM